MKIEIDINPEEATGHILTIDGRNLLIMPNGEDYDLIGKTEGNNALGDIVADFFQNWAPGLAAAERAARQHGAAATWEPLVEATYEKVDDALFYN